MTNQMIKIEIQAFAAAADAMATRHEIRELAMNATVQDAWNNLLETCPGLGPLEDTIAFACNDQLVPRHAILQDGDQLSLLPPVSGG
ncbi:MAG: MoaD/ThiS family protein [Phycisphaerales bacterium]|nr:MoaD/ThiS family protein [Phycisphaerales bacterium]